LRNSTPRSLRRRRVGNLISCNKHPEQHNLISFFFFLFLSLVAFKKPLRPGRPGAAKKAGASNDDEE